ncbi:hypothetical protein ACWGCW_31520 [Streptomyces sp. NPDC054933]
MKTLKTRAAALALVAYGTALYVLAETLHALRGTAWQWLERHLDRVGHRLDGAEGACVKAGDTAFAERVGVAIDRITDAVDRVTSRLARQG